MPSYNSKDVSVILRAKKTGEPFIAKGFADGARVNVVKNSEAASVTVGTDGGWCFNLMNDESGVITLSLLQSSATNDYLSTQANLQKLLGEGVLEVTVKDNRGRSLHHCAEARIEKIPDSAYEEEVGAREWNLLCPEIEDFVGGNN